MEAEYAGQRRRRRLVIIVGLLLAVVAAGAVYYLVSRPTGQTPTAQQTIVVASKDIPARTVITADMVRTETVDQNAALATVVSDPARAIGSVSAIAIKPGDPITLSMLGVGTVGGIDIMGAGATIGPDTPDWRAVSIEVPKDRAVSGLVKEGDYVDVFATLSIKIYDPTGASTDNAILPQGYYSDNTTKIAWSDLQVLNADADNDLYVLRVDEHSAEEIAHVQGSGANSFTMSLRAAADARDIDRSGYGETTNRILEQYNFPIPQVVNLGDYPQPSPQPSPFVP